MHHSFISSELPTKPILLNNYLKKITMKESIVLLCFLLAKSVSALPDFMHLLNSTGTTQPPQDDEFKFSPFFQMFSGTPPNSSPAPLDPRPTPVPNPRPTPLPTPPPVAPVGNPLPESDTRTAFYQYQWGATSDGCRFGAPRTIIKCMSGGILLLQELSNADCEELALDVVKCSQIEKEDDAIVEFQCVGNTHWHLTATARTLPSEATECTKFDGQDFGGTAVAASSLGRFCKDPNVGAVSLDQSYACTEGEPGLVDGAAFCTSKNGCTGMDCSAFIGAMSITAYDEREECSTPEIHQDLTNFSFNPSSLASFHALTWTFSDQGFLCDWRVPDIEISCRDGGLPQIVEEVDFCHTPIGSQVIVCTNPDPTSEDGRVLIELGFWCFGNTVEQLVLDAKTLDVDMSGFTCEPEGILVQGLDIARGCGGELQGEGFTLFKTPAFCVDPEQYHQDLCFSGFSCPSVNETCTDVTFEPVLVDTSAPAVASCIYAEQL